MTTSDLPGLAEANQRQRAGRRRGRALLGFASRLRTRTQLAVRSECGTIIRMRLSEVSRGRGKLPADGLAAGDRGSPATADQPVLAARPGPDRPGRDQPDGSRSLAERLARLPDAHPSAWPGAARSTAGRSSADWAGARTGAEPASEDIWWRGESDIWWRVPDGSPGEADCDDDTGGLADPGELADSGNLADADGPAGADRAADAGATGQTGEQGSGTGGRGARRAAPVPGSAGPDHGTRDGPWGGAGLTGPDQSGPEYGHYRPWFSAAGSGDPWFAAGLEYRAGS